MSEQPAPEPSHTEVAPTPAPLEPAADQPFSVLRVLATAWRVTKRNLIPFLVLACVLQTPVSLLDLGIGEEAALFAIVLQLITGSLTSAVITYGVIMELQGSRPSTRACITTGFAQLGRVLGVTLVSTILIVGAMLALIVPGVIVALMFYVIVPVTVVENVGIRAAMKRSSELTDGRKGDLFLILALGGLVNIAVELVAHYELGAEAALGWRAAASVFSTMFFSVTTAVVYVALRQLREGTKVPELATAFARIRK